MLRALDVDAIALRDELAPDISDLELFEILSEKNTVFVTSDRKIRTRDIEAQTLRRARVTSLFISPFWNKRNFWEQAAWLVSKWPKIDAFAQNAAKGTCAIVQQNGQSKPFQL